MFDEVTMQKVIDINGQTIVMNHYPFLCYSGSYDHRVWAIHGHVHQNPYNIGLDSSRLQYRFPTQYDVGVDNNNFYPISFDQLSVIINEQINNYEKARNNK